MEEILAGVRGDEDETLTLYYECWTAPGSELNEATEIARACGFAPDLVCAKSMGAVLTLLGVSSGSLQPRSCVLIGTPLAGLRADEREVLTAWHTRSIATLFIQQTADRTGSFEELSNLVTATERCILVEVAGHDHVYSDTPALISHICRWRSAK